MKELHLSHGLNLHPSRLESLAIELDRKPIIHSLSDHLHKDLGRSGIGQWKIWQDEARQWVKSFNHDSDLLCYSISAPLILNALLETKLKINKLVLISPAFFPRFALPARKILNILDFNFYVPSFNSKADRCTNWVQSDLYREIFEHLAPPVELAAKKSILLMHRFDEILDTKQTLEWAKHHSIELTELKTPFYPPFHATYRSKRLPIDQIKFYLNSNT